MDTIKILNIQNWMLTLTVVLQKLAVSEDLSSKLQGWTLSRMFRSKLEGKCPLATTSSVYLELEESLAKHLARDLSEEIGINFMDNSQLCSKSGIKAVDYINIMILQIIPWFVHLYGHALKALLDGRNVEFWSMVRLMRFTLAEDCKAPAAVEIPLQVSIATQAVTLTRDFFTSTIIL
ncbi:hypothetical protein SELMODRAFT_422871 [Selaginella moellendorffii]|uniref:Uncharacterized protein n=1 Tax=Selaginella moellendorffii TaxID=88036 RepID=D8SJU0_SELML|nr:hypothetical protein SELMODRAFT_422871 [Selaginella moellendorffii]